MKTVIQTALFAVALTASTSFAGHTGQCAPGDARSGYMQTTKGPRFSTNLTVQERGHYYASDSPDSRRTWSEEDRNWEQNRNLNRQDRDIQSSKENRNNDRS